MREIESLVVVRLRNRMDSREPWKLGQSLLLVCILLPAVSVTFREHHAISPLLVGTNEVLSYTS